MSIGGPHEVLPSHGPTTKAADASTAAPDNRAGPYQGYPSLHIQRRSSSTPRSTPSPSVGSHGRFCQISGHAGLG